MKLEKKIQKAYKKVIRVDDWKLVVMLRHMGFEMPLREYPWVSEDIAEWALPHVMEDSVYIYPYSDELLQALDKLRKSEASIQRKELRHALDTVKIWFGIGSSKLQSFEIEELANGKHQITPHK